MAEIIGTLNSPVFVKRVSIHDFKHLNRTRKAVRKALKNQMENKGFSFVEILAPCPTGWKMTPVDSEKWIRDQMIPYFPLETFKDITGDVEPEMIYTPEISQSEMFKILGLKRAEETSKSQQNFVSQFLRQEVKIAGFGGQGVLSAGVMLANSGMTQGLHVSWIPSYGPEMRGGTANCSVIISKDRIGSPLTPNPNVLIAMNGPSLDAFENDVQSGGLIIINTSMVTRKVKRDDVKTLYVPFTEIAAGMGLVAAANMVLLGAYLEFTKIMSLQSLLDTVPVTLKKKQLIDINLEAVKAGVNYVKEHYPS